MSKLTISHTHGPFAEGTWKAAQVESQRDHRQHDSGTFDTPLDRYFDPPCLSILGNSGIKREQRCPEK